MRFAVDRLDHLVINCRDLEVMASWYQRVLGMERVEFGEPRRTALRFGGQKINLRPHDASTDSWVAAADCSPGTQDLCFVVTFATAEARDAYLDDPSHRPVAEAIGAAAERIVVFDI